MHLEIQNFHGTFISYNFIGYTVFEIPIIYQGKKWNQHMMLCLNIVENGNTHGEFFRSMFACRYRNFMQRQNYDAYVMNEIAEYDRYDTPGTYYLVWLDENQVVRGTIRVNCMDKPTMLSEVFKDLVQFEELPISDDCWEGTRICIDRELPGELRTQIKNELVMGTIEFCMSKGGKFLYGMMQNAIFRYVYEKTGVQLTYLGPTYEIGGQKCRVAKHPTNLQLLMSLRMITGIHRPIVANLDSKELMVA